jgi:hypothetical protein
VVQTIAYRTNTCGHFFPNYSIYMYDDKDLHAYDVWYCVRIAMRDYVYTNSTFIHGGNRDLLNQGNDSVNIAVPEV